ncbi:hypothetical protein C0993_006904 [Termitomyces sp. T159_Od127]|nr:hypothetical protein C0993_006904 [Termitomyces sp. T159_Od127]
MRISSAILAIFASVLAVSASKSHNNHALDSRHSRIFVRSPTLSTLNTTNNKRKRCKARHPAPKSTSYAKPKTTTTKATSTSQTWKAIATSKPEPAKALVNVGSSCGGIGATTQTTRTTGPNGSIDWLNCGLNGGGWNPPYVQIDDLVFVDLSAAISSGKGAFLLCKPFVQYFYKYGQKYDIPPIMLAAFAMQESSCNPETVGGAGEQGLMQLTKDKCGGAPGGNCRDPNFNVETGAKYFAATLKANGGNVLAAVGTYNGWYKGMTYVGPFIIMPKVSSNNLLVESHRCC